MTLLTQNKKITAFSKLTGQTFGGEWLTLMLLVLSLCNAPYKKLAVLAWTLLALIILFDPRKIAVSFFFYAGFFHPSPFLQNSWLTLKPLHLWFLLSIVTGLRTSLFRKQLQLILRFLWDYLPLWGCLMIGWGHFLLRDHSLMLLKIPLNLGLVFFLMAFGYALTVSHMPSGILPLLSRGLFYLVVAIDLQIGIAIWNALFRTHMLNLVILQNNHLGLWGTLTVFYVLTMTILAETSKSRFGYLCLLCIHIGGILASCSRTSWFCFALGMTAYFLVSRKVKALRNKINSIFIRLIGIIFSLGIFLYTIFSHIRIRINDLLLLFRLDYLQFTLQDHQNFGFLGRFRLRQLGAIQDILGHHLLLGVGFSRQVVDFHNVYFLFLGASGIVGFCLFLYFLYRQILRFSFLFSRAPSEVFFLWNLSCACALGIWLTASLMECQFLQFIIWIPFLTASLLSFELENRARTREPSPRSIQSTCNSDPVIP